MTKLKPCPFCGQSPPDDDDLIDVVYPSGWYWKILPDGTRDYFTHGKMRSKNLPYDGREYTVGCRDWYGGCGAKFPETHMKKLLINGIDGLDKGN